MTRPECEGSAREAYAKINLTLEITGKRTDGYHEIASVVQVIDLRDTLYFRPDDHISLSCSVPQLAWPGNLVIQAVKLLQDAVGTRRGVAISLDKGIPVAAGLGGGSSDAAVTLEAVKEMWGLGLGRESLCGMAARLGSDVPFFVGGGRTAVLAGRGEKVTYLPSPPRSWVVLVRPPIQIANKTREMYARVSPSQFTTGDYTRTMAEAIEKGDRVALELCYNVFDDIGFSSLGKLADYRDRFLTAGAAQVHLAGSGPALFSLVQDRSEAEDICRRLRKQNVEVYVAETV